MSTAGVRQSLSASLRLTSDIWFREHGRIEVHPASALKIMDHHLHASGIIPSILVGGNKQNGIHPHSKTHHHQQQQRHRIYEHDWLCVGQSITCFPMDVHLVSLSLESEWSTFSHLWVDSVGNASLNLGNLITLDSHVLVSCRRVFVRKFADSTKSAPFTQQERFRLEKECSIDETISEILSMDTMGIYGLPLSKRFGTLLPKATPASDKCCLKVTVGPQHVNFGNHADHAFLMETAIHAAMISKLPVESLSIQYISEARLGYELECYCHEDRIYIVRRTQQEGNDDIATTTTTTTTDKKKKDADDSTKKKDSTTSNNNSTTGKQVLVAIAKGASKAEASGMRKKKQ